MTVRGLARLSPSALRITEWQGRHDVALLAPSRGGPALSLPDVVVCLDALRCNGYRTAFTTALGPDEQQPFLAAGFALHERLHLLEHPLRELPDMPPVAWHPRRHHRGELRTVLAVDRAAFSEFWQFDEHSLREARQATPVSRLRVVGEPECLGYAVFGRAQTRGYLQRLAVRPDATGQGLGSALVIDGLLWLCHHGVDQVIVNTQESNQRAFELYQHLGFRPCPAGLAVLRRALGNDSTPP